MEPSPALLPLPTLAPPVLDSPPDRRLRWPRLRSPVNGISADVLPPKRENRSLTWGKVEGGGGIERPAEDTRIPLADK